jgi:hypothetical protein
MNPPASRITRSPRSPRLRAFALAHLVLLIPLVLPAATEGPYTYTVTDGQATITGFDYTYSGALSITNELGGCPVISIGPRAFYDCTSLTSVTVPDSVTNIEDEAFEGCSALTSVTIGNRVACIGWHAFFRCSALSSVTIGNNVTTIESSTFRDCSALTFVLFTGDVPTTFFPDAFENTPATLYHLPSATGWPSTLAGRPVVCWNPAFSPASPPRFESGAFAFSLTGNTNIPVRIEACDSLTSPSWDTVADIAIPATGTFDFTDPGAATRPSRFYRILFPR